MQKLKKLLYILPFVLLLFACTRKNGFESNKTTEKEVVTTNKTTEKPTTTEQKFNVNVALEREDAATITGTGEFSKNSNTTITITVNNGYIYNGLYNGTTLLTNELTYEITNITSDINLTAKFGAEVFSLTSSVEDDTLGSIEVADGNYECGSIIHIKANPIEGYKLEGWYVGTSKISDKDELDIKMLAFDFEIVAKFTIKTLTVTINDNVNGTGEYWLYYGSNYGKYSTPMTFEYGEYIEINFNDITGYSADYALLNNEEIYYYGDYITEDLVIDVFYKIKEYTFRFDYDTDKLKANPINLLTTPVEVVSYDKTNGYFAAKYAYNSEVSFTLRVKEDYSLTDVIESNLLCECEITKSKTESLYTVTFTITDDLYFNLELEGRICNIQGLCDSVQGKTEIYSYGSDTTAVNELDCEFGTYITITAIPNKGYKFVKWTTESGGELQMNPYNNNQPEILYHCVKGDVKAVAVFAPDDFLVTYYMKSNDNGEPVKIKDWYSTYLSTVKIDSIKVDGYTFAGWYENAESTEVSSTENTFEFVMTNESLSIYTYYTQNTYTITLDSNNGVDEPYTQQVVYGDIFNIDAPTKENMTFAGYAYYKEEETHTVNAQYSYSLSDYMTKFMKVAYCNSMINMGKVLVNGEVETNKERYVSTGDVIEITAHLTYRIAEIGERFLIAENCTLVATWGATVTKRYNNGEADYPLFYNLGDKVSYYGSLERTGYNFLGWYVGDELYNFNSIIEHDIIIEAKWEVINYSLILEINNPSYGEIYEIIDGENVEPRSKAHYGDVITLTFVAGDIYTFEKWYFYGTKENYYTETITITMPADNVRYKVYVTALTMNVQVNDSTRGTVENGTIISRAGKELTIKAIPNPGYGFDYWEYEGEFYSDSAETTIIMPNLANAYVKAIFGKEKTENYERLGDKIWFGYYPQTCLNENLQDQKNETLISELRTKAGKLPMLDNQANYNSTKNNTEWINYSDYSFYVGSPWNDGTTLLNAPHMWYIDIDYDGNGRYDYRGVLIYSNRADEIGKSAKSTSNTQQDDNYYGSNNAYMDGYYRTYWFRYEKIEWDILENNDGTVKMIANLAIDSQNFSLGSNNYTSSYIRRFLNEDFYNTAFSDLEKELMTTMSIGTNNDYVTLLSNEEVEAYFTTVQSRYVKQTDYAKSQNCYVNNKTTSTTKGNSYWLTRSAYTNSGEIYYVTDGGLLTNGKTNMTYYGIRPIITITLKQINV